MAREEWEEKSFQVFTDEDGVLRSGYYPTGTGTVQGNMQVDFVWGNFPLQPNDDRDDSYTEIGGGDGDVGWSSTETISSDTLRYNDYVVDFNNVGGTVNVPADSHIIVRDDWSGYPGFEQVPDVVGRSYLNGDVESILSEAGLDVGTVTRVASYSVGKYGITGNRTVAVNAENRGRVVVQSPVAGDGIPQSGEVNLVILDNDTTADVIVPNIVGLAEEGADDALTAVNLVSGTVTTTGVGATEANDGKVKTQSVAAGAVVNEGTAVNYVLYLYVDPEA